MNRLMSPFLVFVSVMALSIPMNSALAQAGSDCRPGEYVMTVSPIHQLKQKAILEISEVSENPVIVDDEAPRAILVKSLEPQSFHNGSVAVSTEISNELCNRIRSGKRAKRRQRAKGQISEIVRNISCGCNANISASAPNDPYYTYQWGLNQANNIDIDAPEAWAQASSLSNVVIGVIDTGVQYDHPDLSAAMWRNPGEIADNNLDDDGNGYVDDVYGLNTISGSGSAMDDHGHGTHCAGVIGASVNNGIGMTGISAHVSIIAVKFLDATGNGSTMDAIKGIDYLVKMKESYGVNIVASNNSWGGPSSTSGPLGDAIMRHQNAGMLFIAAAGNSGVNIDQTPHSPAGFGADSLVSVAAVDSYGALANFSNYSSTKVDLGAPGVNIYSTFKDSTYRNLQGTSMAAPFVTGAVAFINSAFPGITWQNLKQLLLTTGKPLSSLSGKTVSGKMLSLNNLFLAAQPLPRETPTPSPTPTRTPTPQPTATFTPSPTPTMTPTLVPGYWNVTGTVTGNGSPVANAVVRLSSNTGTFTRLTDSAGRYSFNSIYTSPSITVSVEAPGFKFAPASRVLGSSLTVDFWSAAQLFELAARIVTSNGSPIPGLTVNGGTLGSAVTDAQGYARFYTSYGAKFSLRALGNQSWIITDPDRRGTLYGNTERIWIGKEP